MFGDQVMSLDLFKRVADEIAKYPHSSIRLHSVGEPLLWKDIGAALSYIREKGVTGWLFTSLVSYDIDHLYMLAASNAIIEVSMNSIDAKDYHSTKGIDCYGLVKTNLRKVRNIIDRNRYKTRLIASRVESDDKDYDKAFVSYWKKSGIVDDAFIRSYHDYNGKIDSKGKDGRQKVIACHVHWGRFNIDTNGDAVVCFNELFSEYDDSLVLGNVIEEPISQIWQGEKLSKIRQAQLCSDYSIVDFTDKMPCIHCSYCQPLETSSVKSEHQLEEFCKK
jgi:MoaA/NifB/PqqE/SkfB family radical SAM enzyme